MASGEMMHDTFSQQLVVLVGGKGTRLGELTRDTPKPLMPVDGGRVFLDYVLAAALRQGFTEVLLLAGAFADQIQDRYGDTTLAGAAVHVVTEPEPLGTGGAFRHALDRLAPAFVAINGDTLFDINIRALDHDLHRTPDALAVIAVREIADAGRFGSLVVQDQRVLAFREKDPLSEARPGLINGGIYALRREAVEQLPAGASSIENDLFPALAAQGRLVARAMEGYFCDIGLPETLAQARSELPARRRPALFLDRDGVLNEDKGYVHRPEDLIWCEGAMDAVRLANDRGWAVIVVTNQAGVARGYYGEGDVLRLHRHMQEALMVQGAFADGFYYCPYHTDAVVPRYRIAGHIDRKPGCGMLRRAARDHGLDLARSVMVGDQESDLESARVAGVRALRFTGGNLRNFIDAHGVF